MRDTFFTLLKRKMKEDESIFLVVADMGMGLMEPFQEAFPDRFINVGIAEQNMIGIASGLCNAGYRPFCYTISNFLTQRCFEQIRNDVIIHNYPITLVGTSTGYDNGILGATHYPIDDIGCMKILPSIRIYSPSSVLSTEACFNDILNGNEPAYIRIGKGSLNIVHEKGLNYFVTNNEKAKVLLVTHSNTLEYCIKASELNSQLSVYCVNQLKPFDNSLFRTCFADFDYIVVVEEQLKSSGLYNIMCQCMIEQNIINQKLYRIGPDDQYPSVIGDKRYFAQMYGFEPYLIDIFARKIIGGKL